MEEKEEVLTGYEILSWARTALATELVSCMYGAGSGEIEQYIAGLKGDESFRLTDPNELSTDEALGLGFRVWDYDTTCGKILLLMPLWVMPFIVPEWQGGSIIHSDSRNPKTLVTEKLDKDTRYGVLAYGVWLPKQD